MKKSQTLLLKLANKFQNKYAQSQDLQQILENAASYGESSANGIMNFPAKLKADNADLTLTITVSSGMMGGKNIAVSVPVLDPPEVAGNYAKLPEQIKKYLEKHIASFPQISEGESIVKWTGKSQQPGVAQN